MSFRFKLLPMFWPKPKMQFCYLIVFLRVSKNVSKKAMLMPIYFVMVPCKGITTEDLYEFFFSSSCQNFVLFNFVVATGEKFGRRWSGVTFYRPCFSYLVTDRKIHYKLFEAAINNDIKLWLWVFTFHLIAGEQSWGVVNAYD